MTWREKYRRDPDLAESIIEALRRDFEEAQQRIETLETALKRIRDNDWVQLGGPPKWISKIAKEALE